MASKVMQGTQQSGKVREMKSGQGKSGKMAKYSKKSGKVREIAAKIERKALIIKLFFFKFFACGAKSVHPSWTSYAIRYLILLQNSEEYKTPKNFAELNFTLT